MIINTQQFIEPSVDEQVVVATIEGLRRCEKVLGYEFAEAIYHIEKLYALKRQQKHIEISQEQRLDLESERGNALSYEAEVAYEEGR